jgi:hypothetical protein
MFTSSGHFVVVTFSEKDIQLLQSICGKELEPREIRNLTILIKNPFGSLNLTLEVRQPHISDTSDTSDMTVGTIIAITFSVILASVVLVALGAAWFCYKAKPLNW